MDRLTPVSAQTHKTSRLAEEERGLRSSDSAEEEKETQKNEPKEKYQKRHDSDKEEKSRKEPKGLKTFKEIKTAFDLFKKLQKKKMMFLKIVGKKKNYHWIVKPQKTRKPRKTSSQ